MKNSPEGTLMDDSIEPGSMRSYIKQAGSVKFKLGSLRERKNEIRTFASTDQLVS